MTVERGLERAVPSAEMPRRLAEILRPELASLATEIVDEIRVTIPVYARLLDGQCGKPIRAGVEYAIKLFVEQIADPAVSKEQSHEVHHRLGQNEMREGRSLDTLQSAYRVGARVSWRRIMDVGRRSGLSSAVVSQLADAMLAFMDELASVALDGYLEAKARTAGALEMWRHRLLDLLLQHPAAPAKTICDLAQLTGWAVPEVASPIALQPMTITRLRRHVTLDSDLLFELEGAQPRIVVPGAVDSARLATLQAALPDHRLSVGPCVPLGCLADSLRWARAALRLADRGRIAHRRVHRAEDHLGDLLVNSDAALVDVLRARLFAPLAGMTDKQQERLLETLRAWLDSQGNVVEIAELLQIHPQTVRYRMRQLQATFGHRLRDPAARFEMALVLRATAPRRSTAGPWPGPFPPTEVLPSPRRSPQWTTQR
ncbi:CdaR family transcriptional regulator [Amycolatopsis sp. FDAARGOS 1241]|uniref:PucR family transcriptional regulator n=1 Tax=Amycolatopsis sp. FDAARGOS 1241 TaxID=2778070 RepID=UPI0019505A93|nr:helix-turn-helix domain-containing protein [Amycolatopsis sp. FDAARGOS 1241]QRP44482.1 helix-turn-helix domain-containing protein [Amycolatopsis sp. FDAARGOS 1241]